MTDTPKVSCKVYVDCPVNHSEDSQKVRHALSNIFPEMEFQEKNFGMHGTATDPQCLEHLCEKVRSRQSQKSLRKQIRINSRDDSFWFYLNKQAAFSDVAAVCEHDDESPLGPIKVSVISRQAESIIGWLVQA